MDNWGPEWLWEYPLKLLPPRWGGCSSLVGKAPGTWTRWPAQPASSVSWELLRQRARPQAEIQMRAADPGRVQQPLPHLLTNPHPTGRWMQPAISKMQPVLSETLTAMLWDSRNPRPELVGGMPSHTKIFSQAATLLPFPLPKPQLCSSVTTRAASNCSRAGNSIPCPVSFRLGQPVFSRLPQRS